MNEEDYVYPRTTKEAFGRNDKGPLYGIAEEKDERRHVIVIAACITIVFVLLIYIST